MVPVRADISAQRVQYSKYFVNEYLFKLNIVFDILTVLVSHVTKTGICVNRLRTAGTLLTYNVQSHIPPKVHMCVIRHIE